MSEVGMFLKKRKSPLKKKLPIIIPSVFPAPSWKEYEPDKDADLINFMQECRERTVSMKDKKKCEYCKLRFRCYTEIKIEKKKRKRKIDQDITKDGLKRIIDSIKNTKSLSTKKSVVTIEHEVDHLNGILIDTKGKLIGTKEGRWIN